MTEEIRTDRHGDTPPMRRRDDPPARMLREIERYWRGLAGPGTLPRRDALDPGRIDDALSNAFILERVAPSVARIRVAGQFVSETIGGEVRGMPLSALLGARSRPALAEALLRLWDGPALVELPLVSPGFLGRPRRHGRLLLLPLLDGHGAPTRALGVMAWSGRPMRQFEIDTGHPPRIEPLAPAAPALKIVAETTGPERKGAASRRPPGLRLVVSNG